MDILMNFINGFCMALADSVPGVSGGTIAFILGFYDKFIGSLNNLIKGNKEERKAAIIFLVKLMSGWIVGFLIAMAFLANIVETKIYVVSSVFLGLIIFAIPVIIMEEKETLKGKYKNSIFTLIGILVVVAITYFNPASGQGMNVNIDNLSIGLILYTLIAGMVSISAMVLPGISGSTLLLIFGLYMPIVSAIKECMHLNLSYLPIIIVFAIGIIIGILLTIRIIKISLEKHRSAMIYLIIGLMIGSLYAIVMGPTTLEIPQKAMDFSTFNILWFIVGGLIIGGLQGLKIIIEKKTAQNK